VNSMSLHPMSSIGIAHSRPKGNWVRGATVMGPGGTVGVPLLLGRAPRLLRGREALLTQQ
jgi:hypothetical protein